MEEGALAVCIRGDRVRECPIAVQTTKYRKLVRLSCGKYGPVGWRLDEDPDSVDCEEQKVSPQFRPEG